VTKGAQSLAEAADQLAHGRFKAALRALDAVPAELAGRDRLLGLALLGRRKGAEALAILQRVALADPADRDIRLALGRAWMLAAEPGRAGTVFASLLAEAPDDAQAAEALVEAWRADARYDDALRLVGGWAAPTPQMLYDKAVCLARLGDGPASLAACDALLAIRPDLAAAWFASHGPAIEIEGWAGAQRRLMAAAGCAKANGRYGALLAAYDVLAGRPPRPHDGVKHGHLVESAAAITPMLAPDWRLFGVAASLLRHGLELARIPGLVLEFGVRRGASLTVLAQNAGQDVHGFDSFQGLPEDGWSGTPRGVLHTDAHLPMVPANAHLHPGWFDQTLAPFLAKHAGPVRLVNIDSDIHASARTVLFALAPRLVPGSVVVFDEFVGNRGWRDDEFKAWDEFSAAFGVSARMVAVNLACKQVVLMVDG
jgi:tetratricopeptide (TPR) repeat protein